MIAADDTAGQVAERSQLHEWWRFLSTLVLILSPALIALGALEGLAWWTGEAMSVAAASKWQDGAPGRIWRGGDGHSFLPYKLARVADLKPEVLVLGPSRANQFTGKPFAPYSFYDAGQTAWTIDQYRGFLELITRNGYAPRVMVINLDYWMFSPGFDHYWGDRFDDTSSSHIADLLRLIGQLRDDPLGLLRRLPKTDRLQGLYAVLTGDGFRRDGSVVEKPSMTDPQQRLSSDDVEVGVPPVVLADHMSPDQIANFDRLVALAKEKHVALIGVQLPYYQKVLNALNSNPEAGSWREFESAEWRQRLAKAGVRFFDFADMPEFCDKPEYFIDSLDPDARVVDHVSRLIVADPRTAALLPQAAPEAR
jgi:hypothetical protein